MSEYLKMDKGRFENGQRKKNKTVASLAKKMNYLLYRRWSISVLVLY